MSMYYRISFTEIRVMCFLVATICAMTAVGWSTPSFAARFAPPGTDFTITGALQIQRTQQADGANCKVTLRGQVTDTGKLKIKNASFCHRIQPYGLPWFWTAERAHNPPLALYNMAFQFQGGRDCGTLDTDLIFPSDGRLHFHGQFTSKGCSLLSGEATVSPTIMIVH